MSANALSRAPSHASGPEAPETQPAALLDGRISERASHIVRGVQLMLAEAGFATLTEVTLSSGRRADVMALSPKGDLTIIEVKSCLQDFATDRKWPEYGPWCDRFLFAVDCDFPQDRIPPEAGLIVADRHGGAILREPEAHPLVPARRKAVTLMFARLAAARLLRAGDPATFTKAFVID
jgi:hypothetical protein